MKTLKFVVKDKQITRQDCCTVVDGVVNQYEFRIAFDADWDGLTKTVVWENGDAKVELLYANGLILPWEVCRDGALMLSVNGTKTLGDGRTQIVRTARMTRPIQVVPHGSESGEKPGEFTPSLSEQILARMDGVEDAAEAAKRAEQAAEKFAAEAKGAAGCAPYVGENGNWYQWSAEAGTMADSGVKAEGRTGAKGDKGDKGDTGPQGEKGETGSGFRVLGYYASVESLRAAVTTPKAGDAYSVGAAEPYEIYIYDGTGKTWVNNGTLQGAKGDKGDTGPRGPQGEKGETGGTGPKGEDGKDGVTPTIGANGNWYLGSVDTGKPSRGEQGEAGAAIFPVELTGSDDTEGSHDDVTADKTFAEIFQAWQDGMIVRVKWNSWVMDVVQIDPDWAEFAAVIGGLDSGGEVSTVTAICDSSDYWMLGYFTGSIPEASAAAPKMDGTAAAGSSADYARADHVHPTDTSRQAKITLTGLLYGSGNGNLRRAQPLSDYISPTNLTSSLNRSTNVNAADTNYTTLMARGESLNAAETTPAVNGAIAWVYG